MSTPNIHNILVLLVANDVDFSVENGVTNFKDNRTRAAMTIHFDAGQPEGKLDVRIEFGDKKYGQLVSRIHKDGDHTAVIPIETVYRRAEEQRVARSWFTSATLAKMAVAN